MSEGTSRFAAGGGAGVGRRDFLKVAGLNGLGLALLGGSGCAGMGGIAGLGDSGPVKIGAILSFSGTFAPLSESIRNGMTLYFDQNGNKIGNRPIDIKWEDDEANPQTALRKYTQLTQRDNVNIMCGIISSAVALALVESINRDKMPFIISNAAANDLSWSQKSNYIYRVSFSNWQNGTAGAEYLAKNVGKTAYALGPDYPAGKENVAAFKAAFEAAGGKVIKEAYPPLGANDYATFLNDIQQVRPELVWAFVSGADALRFLQQYQEFGLKGRIQLCGPQELGDDLVIGPAGDAAEGIIAWTWWTSYLDNPTNKKFVDAYRQKFNKAPNLFSVAGYDTAQVITKAVEAAKGTKADDVVKALNGISFDSPRGPTSIDPVTHNPVQSYFIVRDVKRDGTIIQDMVAPLGRVAMPEKAPNA